MKKIGKEIVLFFCFAVCMWFSSTVIYAADYTYMNAPRDVNGEYILKAGDSISFTNYNLFDREVFNVSVDDNNYVDVKVEVYSLTDEISFWWGEDEELDISVPGIYYMNFDADQELGDVFYSLSGYDVNCSFKLTFLKKKLSIEMDPESINLTIGGKTKELSYMTVPFDYSSGQDEKWISTNKIVVRVDDEGELTAKKLGTAKIKVILDNGLRGEATVRVNKIKMTMGNGVKYNLKSLLSEIPSGYKIKNKTMKIVSLKGKTITAKKTGTAKLEVLSKGQKYYIYICF